MSQRSLKGIKPLFIMVHLDLNFMLACAVPTSKNTRSACAQPGTRDFLLIYTQTEIPHV